MTIESLRRRLDRLGDGREKGGYPELTVVLVGMTRTADGRIIEVSRVILDPMEPKP